MSIPASAVTNAYSAVSRIGGEAPQAKSASTVDFGDMLKQAVDSVVESGRNTDKVSVEVLAGKADVVDVVTAMAETELALETMVSVRDRIVSAYEEIMRMPI